MGIGIGIGMGRMVLMLDSILLCSYAMRYCRPGMGSEFMIYDSIAIVK